MLARYILMGIGTVLALLFIIQTMRGKQFAQVVEDLDDNMYPLHELYVEGFVWGLSGIFALRGKMASKLKMEAGLLYDSKYADYYANIAWAQTITLTHLFLTMTFLVAGIMYSMAGLLLVAGLFMSLIMAVYCVDNMKNTLSSRKEECERELPEVVSTMAILMNSGMVLRETWATVAESKDGAFYELMRKASVNMENGMSDEDAIFLFGKESNSTEVKKFTSALLQSMERSGAELTGFLARQSSELWGMKRQMMLQEGEKAATKLLLPIVLIFIGVIIIVMTAAFAGALF